MVVDVNRIAMLKYFQTAITNSQLANDKWTIDNKYYSANVRFIWETKDLFEGFGHQEEEDVPPAVIWLFENDKVDR